MLFRPFCFTGCSCMKHPEWPGAAIKNAFVSHHKRQRRVHPLRYHSYLPARFPGGRPLSAHPTMRGLITEACRPGLHTAAAVSARKLGEDLPTGFMHCLASTGSSLKHSTRVLVLVIAEYFTDTEYTPLQALRQGAAACCFFMPETAQNNPAHPTERVGCEYSAKKSVWNLCNQTKEKTNVGEISTKTRKIYLHVKQNTSIIK